MRLSWACAAVAAAALLAGCDESSTPASVGPGQGAAAPQVKRSSIPVVAADLDVKPSVKPAPTDESDPGRVDFDGDKPRPSLDGGPVAASGGPRKKPKVKFTAGSAKPTLAVSEPPPPSGYKVVGGAGPVVKASYEAKGGGGCPAEMAPVGSFCVDKYEAALVDDSGAAWSPYLVPDPGKTYKAVSRAGQIPQGYISGEAAGKACAAAGKRLCKTGEWEKACRGPQGTTFPYGGTMQPGTCNEHDRDPTYTATIQRVFPGVPQADIYGSYKRMNDPRINQQPNGLLPTGAKTGCTNGYGLYDMVGNLHEWVDDAKGRFNGGYYNKTLGNGGDGCAYRTVAHAPSYHDYSTGFRCCADLK